MEQLTDSVVNIRNVLERGVEVSVILVYLSKMIANTMISYSYYNIITMGKYIMLSYNMMLLINYYY